MAHHNQHGGNATAAKRRGESYCACNTCGRRSQGYQEQPGMYETPLDFVKAMAVAVLLAAAMYALVLTMAAYEMGTR